MDARPTSRTMEHPMPKRDSLIAATALAFLSAMTAWSKETPPVLTLERSIPLPGVEGRIDHMVLDAEGKRLLVAALGNGSVEVVDLKSGSVVHRFESLAEPQGVGILPKTGRMAVACGGDGTLRLYDGTTYEAAEKLALGEDADNVRVEAHTGRLFVGYGGGGLAIVEKGKVVAKIPLSGHPEAFELETKGTRVFVNVPPSGQVAVIDRATNKVVATWDVTLAKSNYPMALDEEHHRLFLGCRAPARLLVLDTESGKTVANVESVGDVDDVYYDAASKRLYVSGGGDAIDVLEQTDADHYRVTSHVETAAGARTSLYVPGEKRIYLAVPHRGKQRAEIRVYSITG